MPFPDIEPAHEDALVLKYLYGGVVHYRPGDRLVPRTLKDYELVLMIEGTATYRHDDEEHQAPPGSVILARPDFRESYRWDRRLATRHAYIHFNIATIPSDWPDPGKWPVFHANPPEIVAPMLRYLLENIATQGESDWPTLSAGVEESRFLRCLMTVLLKPSHESGISIGARLPDSVHASLNLMRETLDIKPSRALQLGELAARSGVTEKHLCRLFRKSLGHSPMETFRLLKLQLALALLGRSGLAVKEIADRCGFENPLYFTRCFTRVYGKSPTLVRRSLLRSEPPPPNPLPSEIAPRIYW